MRDTHATNNKKKREKKNLLIRGKAIECITRPSQVITRPIYPCITRFKLSITRPPNARHVRQFRESTLRESYFLKKRSLEKIRKICSIFMEKSTHDG